MADIDKTLKYYNENAQSFASGTVSVKFTEVQDKFLEKLNPDAYILDFGCGAGRDTKYFLSRGYQVDAVDGSEQLCRIASEYTGIKVRQMLFQELDEKEKILEYIDTYRKVYDFAEIVPLSALRGQNTEILTDLIFKYLPYGPQFYDEDTITDQPERQIVAEVIREKALHALNEEIPHGIAVSVDKMKVRKGKKIIDIDATIVCEKDSHKGIIIGKQGSMLKKIGSNARFEIERLLDAKVNLQLWVKVKKDWRDSDFLIKNFGYRKDEM